MRNNLPVTGTEYILQEGDKLVATSDTAGRIIYANRSFLAVSGYREADLVGQSLNIIRHPDMPAGAFADLWATVRAGVPWNGLVKNRRHNGDFYWVAASVVPIEENGRTVGYMSACTRPARARVAEADELYSKMSRGETAAVRIRHGSAVPTGWRALSAALANVPLRYRLGLGLCAQATIMSLLAWHAWGTTWSVLALAGALVALGVLAELLRSVARPLAKATAAVHALAGGDLSHIPAPAGPDEVGRLLTSLHQMAVNFSATVGDMRNNVRAMEWTTHDMVTGNFDLACRTQSQASSLQQAVARLAQIDAAAARNTDSAFRADRMVNAAADVADSGEDAVAQVGATLQGIGTSAARINDIVSLVDAIAVQIDHPALNASLNAACPREPGEGFATAAGALSNLAQRLASAAREVRELIEDAARKVEVGSEQARAVGATMREVIANVRGTAAFMQDISDASREQRQGIAAVNNAMEALDAVRRQNAALVQRSAGASQSLARDAASLAQAVSVFKLRPTAALRASL